MNSSHINNAAVAVNPLYASAHHSSFTRRTQEIVMNFKRNALALAVLMLLTTLHRPAAATVAAGPILNPINNHLYVLLGPSSATAAETEAAQLGGHLVTINDAAENQFVLDNFGSSRRMLWTGMSDPTGTLHFKWNGEPSSFLNWGPAQPGSSSGPRYIAMASAGMAPFAYPGKWYAYANLSTAFGAPVCGVVEIEPVRNLDTDHLYVLLGQATWTESEARAVQLGAHLVTINDVSENGWVQTTFGNRDGVKRMLWIGLNDPTGSFHFSWTSGETSHFLNWAPAEPGNGARYMNMFPAGTPFAAGRWSGYADLKTEFGMPICGVVEIALAGIPVPAISIPSMATPLVASAGIRTHAATLGATAGSSDVPSDGSTVATPDLNTAATTTKKASWGQLKALYR
jgi:hypothetical protein